MTQENLEDKLRSIKITVKSEFAFYYKDGSTKIGDEWGNITKEIPKSVPMDWKGDTLLLAKYDYNTKALSKILIHNLNSGKETEFATGNKYEIRKLTDKNTIITHEISKNRIVEYNFYGEKLASFDNASYNLDSYNNLIGFSIMKKGITEHAIPDFNGGVYTIQTRTLKMKTAIYDGIITDKGHSTKEKFLAFKNGTEYYVENLETGTIQLRNDNDIKKEFSVPLEGVDFSISDDRSTIFVSADQIYVMTPQFEVIKTFPRVNERISPSADGKFFSYDKKNGYGHYDMTIIEVETGERKLLEGAKSPIWRRP